MVVADRNIVVRVGVVQLAVANKVTASCRASDFVLILPSLLLFQYTVKRFFQRDWILSFLGSTAEEASV